MDTLTSEAACSSTSTSSSIDTEILKYGIIEVDIVSKDPIDLFRVWFGDAKALPENVYPEALTLSTVRRDGGPSSRTVLLRGLDDNGFKMYWDNRSRKTAEIENDTRGALVFCWAYRDTIGTIGARQIRIEGILEKLTDDDSTNYFNQEPLLAKIRAIACHQSRVVTDERESMLDHISTLCQKATRDHLELTKPETWGGYRLVPQMMEFYQGQRDSINDRIRFRKVSETTEAASKDIKCPGVHIGENGWVYERLEP